MHCPFCNALDTKVIDSRLIANGSQVRRRRECLSCHERYTTFESAELLMPKVIKKNGDRAPFDEDKLKRGIQRAVQKRPHSVEEIDGLISKILYKIGSCGEREISSEVVGDIVLAYLKQLDEVAYIRFASVYRSFQDIQAFKKMVLGLEQQEITK